MFCLVAALATLYSYRSAVVEFGSGVPEGVHGFCAFISAVESVKERQRVMTRNG